LGSRGGHILLRNAQGDVVSRVSYDHEQAEREGKLLYFHKQRHRRH